MNIRHFKPHPKIYRTNKLKITERTNKQTNKRTRKQTNERMNERTNKRTNEQTQTSQKASKLTKNDLTNTTNHQNTNLGECPVRFYMRDEVLP